MSNSEQISSSPYDARCIPGMEIKSIPLRARLNIVEYFSTLPVLFSSLFLAILPVFYHILGTVPSNPQQGPHGSLLLIDSFGVHP